MNKMGNGVEVGMKGRVVPCQLLTGSSQNMTCITIRGDSSCDQKKEITMETTVGGLTVGKQDRIVTVTNDDETAEISQGEMGMNTEVVEGMVEVGVQGRMEPCQLLTGSSQQMAGNTNRGDSSYKQEIEDLKMNKMENGVGVQDRMEPCQLLTGSSQLPTCNTFRGDSSYKQEIGDLKMNKNSQQVKVEIGVSGTNEDQNNEGQKMKTKNEEMSGVVGVETSETGDQMKTDSEQVGMGVSGTNKGQNIGGNNMKTEDIKMTGTTIENVVAALRKQFAGGICQEPYTGNLNMKYGMKGNKAKANKSSVSIGRMSEKANMRELDQISQEIEGLGGSVMRSFIILREDVESMNLVPYLSVFKRIINDRDMLIRRRQDVSPFISGYDSDPRELCQIPEVRAFIARFDQEFPYWFYFVNPDCGFLTVLLGCHSPLADVMNPANRTKTGITFLKENSVSFLEKYFAPLNWFLDRFNLDDENETINRKIVEKIMKSLGSNRIN